MKKTNTNAQAIVFAQAKDNNKAVVATRDGKEVYLAWTLKQENEKIYGNLGGKRREGVKYFCVDFPTAKNAKAFIAKAITHINAEDYAKARKTEPKAKAEPKKAVPAPAKGKKADDLVTVTLSDGTQLQVKASALGMATEPKKAPRKSKGEVKPTTAPNAPNAKASKSVKADEPKAKATPKKSKGDCSVDFSALAGKGKAANKEAAALMRKAGLTNGKSDEYKAVWAEWCKVR